MPGQSVEQSSCVLTLPCLMQGLSGRQQLCHDHDPKVRSRNTHGTHAQQDLKTACRLRRPFGQLSPISSHPVPECKTGHVMSDMRTRKQASLYGEAWMSSLWWPWSDGWLTV